MQRVWLGVAVLVILAAVAGAWLAGGSDDLPVPVPAASSSQQAACQDLCEKSGLQHVDRCKASCRDPDAFQAAWGPCQLTCAEAVCQRECAVDNAEEPAVCATACGQPELARIIGARTRGDTIPGFERCLLRCIDVKVTGE